MIEFNATFLIAMLSFAVFIMIMNAILYNPVLAIIKKRNQYISSNYDSAETFVQKAQENESKRTKQLEQTQRKCRKEIQNIVNQAQEESNTKTRAAREKSKAEILSRKEKLIQEEQKLQTEINNTVVNDLASAISFKIFGEKTVTNKTR